MRKNKFFGIEFSGYTGCWRAWYDEFSSPEPGMKTKNSAVESLLYVMANKARKNNELAAAIRSLINE